MTLNESRRLRTIELSQTRRIMQNAPEGAINLALGELRFDLPDILREHALSLLQNHTPAYTLNAGIPELREVIANLYPGSRFDQVCVCNGVEEALFVSLISLLDPGDTVAIPDPDYNAYPAICKILEANVIRLPFESDLSTIDWERWDRLLAQGVKALLLSSPSNPSGFFFSEDELERLILICERHQVVLIVDEIYAGLYYDSKPQSCWNFYPDLIILGGVSKSHCMSGWRLGWALAPAALAPALIKARQYVSTCSNWLSQWLAVFALSPQGMEASESIRRKLLSRRRLCLELFGPNRAKVHIPQATPYLMLRVEGDDLSLAERLARKGVLTAPGSAFGEVSRGWLRINCAVPEDWLRAAIPLICDELHPH